MDQNSVPNVTLTFGQFGLMCQAVEDANRTLRRVKRGQKEGYLVSLSALSSAWDSIAKVLEDMPDTFQPLFKDYTTMLNGILTDAPEMDPAQFAVVYGALYRGVDEALIPSLGADNALMLRGMVALGMNEAAKP